VFFCISRVARSPVLVGKVPHYQHSPLINHQSTTAVLCINQSPENDLASWIEAEKRIPLLKSAPWKGYEHGVEKSACIRTTAKTGHCVRNTFGTYDKLRPIHKQVFDISTESLPPPPSPRTLRRVMTIR